MIDCNLILDTANCFSSVERAKFSVNQVGNPIPIQTNFKIKMRERNRFPKDKFLEIWFADGE